MTKHRLLFIIFFLSYIAIISKLFYLQIINPSSVKTNYLKTSRIMPERGRIFDRNGEPMAVNKSSYLLFAEPKKINNLDEFVRKVDSVLQMGEASIEAKIDKNKNWTAIKNDVNTEQKQKLQKIGLKGIGFDDGFLRHYPESSLSAHLLGFVGKDSEGEDIGYFGIEGFYNKELVGFPGIIKSDRDILGRPILIGTQQRLDPENGRDLYLTIDKPVQEIAKAKLQIGLEQYRAKEGCILIADPQTMEILALSCLPDFDVNQYYLFSEQFFKNPAISNLYEPGSTFKPFIMAAALEEKSIKPNDFYEEDGPVKIGEYTIKTWNDKYEGKISMTRIIEKSSNVGMVYISEQLGNKKLYSYLKKYGFAATTGIDLQGEVTANLRKENSWYPIDFATVSFGQGIALTPIQMVQAFSSLINGGKLYKPYAVQKISSSGEEKFTKPEFVRQTIGKKT